MEGVPFGKCKSLGSLKQGTWWAWVGGKHCFLGPGSHLCSLKPPVPVSSPPLPVPVYTQQVTNLISLGKQPCVF